MDSDPYSDNSFIEISRVEPVISFRNEDSIKIFDTVFLNDESETLVFSSVCFTRDYVFLNGTIKALTLKSDEYTSIKRALKRDLDITELKYYKPNFAIKTELFMSPDNIILLEDDKEIPYCASMLASTVLEDLIPVNRIDRINNYIIHYNKRLSTSVFRNIESDEIRKNIIVMKTSKQIVKTA